MIRVWAVGNSQLTHGWNLGPGSQEAWCLQMPRVRSRIRSQSQHQDMPESVVRPRVRVARGQKENQEPKIWQVKRGCAWGSGTNIWVFGLTQYCRLKWVGTVAYNIRGLASLIVPLGSAGFRIMLRAWFMWRLFPKIRGFSDWEWLGPELWSDLSTISSLNSDSSQ